MFLGDRKTNSGAGLIEERRELVARLNAARDEAWAHTCGIEAIDVVLRTRVSGEPSSGTAAGAQPPMYGIQRTMPVSGKSGGPFDERLARATRGAVRRKGRRRPS